jgi:hypothetical protein
VVATDPLTGETTVRTITATHLNRDTDMADLTVTDAAGDVEVIRTTQHHKFWNGTRKAWVDASDLRAGERLRTADGSHLSVVTVRSYTAARDMFDLTVDTVHSFYVVAGETPVLVHNCTLPAGFAGKAEFNAFVGTLHEGLAAAGHGGTRAAFQGSSVTGVGFRSGLPFGSHSDYDIALGGAAIFARARELGIPLRGGRTRTGPLEDAQHLEALGLTGLRTKLTDMAGREVNFMIYSNIDNAIARSPSLPAVACGC